MVYSEISNELTAYKVQTAKGAQATGTGAKVLRLTGGSGGQFSKDPIDIGEIRSDYMKRRGRHGMQKTSGSYDTAVSIGNLDDPLEALMRGTYGTADLALTQTDFTSLTTTTSTIVFASGSPITLGLRVGDVIRMTDFATTANNDRNLRITGLSATTITIAETLTLDASADLTVTLTRTGRVLINPPASSLVKRYFTIEENDSLIDGSEIYTDAVFSSIKFAMAPNGVFTSTIGWTGTGQYETATGASAPFFTTPTELTNDVMDVATSQLLLGSQAIVDLTSFELNIDLKPTAQEVVSSKTSPEVFLSDNNISITLGMLREDMLDIANLISETQLSLSLMAKAPMSAPEDFFNIYVPNFTYGGIDKAALAAGGGGRVQTINIPDSLVGIDTQGGAFDSTMIKFQISSSV